MAWGECPSAPSFIHTFTKICNICIQACEDAGEGTVPVLQALGQVKLMSHTQAKYKNVILRGAASTCYNERFDARTWWDLHLTRAFEWVLGGNLSLPESPRPGLQAQGYRGGVSCRTDKHLCKGGSGLRCLSWLIFLLLSKALCASFSPPSPFQAVKPGLLLLRT